jgi:hypothetical protein
MKKIKFMKQKIKFTGLLLSVFMSITAFGQVNVNINLGKPVAQEQWYGTDNNYYYLPEQGVYYNVSRRVYVYPDGGNWLYAKKLPSRYGSYSYRSSKYVVIRERSPFVRDNEIKTRYANGNNPKAQGRHDNGNHNGSKTVIKRTVHSSHGNGNSSGNNGKAGGKGKH